MVARHLASSACRTRVNVEARGAHPSGDAILGAGPTTVKRTLLTVSIRPPRLLLLCDRWFKTSPPIGRSHRGRRDHVWIVTRAKAKPWGQPDVTCPAS